MEKVVSSQDEGLEPTLTALLLSRLTSGKYGALMAEVKEEWRRASYTEEGAYVAPSMLANTKNYVRKLLRQQALAAGGRVSPESVAVRPENSHERFSVSPNPMVREARLQFRLDSAEAVSLSLHDGKGTRVRELIPGGTYEAGVHAVELSRGDLAPGIYSARLTVGGQVLTRKVSIQ
jgi:hypothetical protein